MSYFRTLDRDAFAKFRTSMRKGGNINPLFGFSEARWDDPLYAKADLAARIGRYELNGRLLVCVETKYGPDYDGHSTPRYHEIPATLAHYKQWLDRMQEESEGVDYYNIVNWFSQEIPQWWAHRAQYLWEQSLETMFINVLSA